MTIRSLLAIIVTLVLTVASTVGLDARAFYVDNQHSKADDMNPGTEDLPWRYSPGMVGWKGVLKLEPGDTVFFNSGSTWEASHGPNFLSVTGGVTYDGKTWGNGEMASFKAVREETLRTLVIFQEDHPVHPTIVRGFDINANREFTTGIGVNWPFATRSLTGAVKRIEDVVVHGVEDDPFLGVYEYGIVISSGYGGNMTVSNVEILNSHVYNIARGGINLYSANDNPIGSSVQNVLISGCEVHNAGIGVRNHVINATIENNLVYKSKPSNPGISINSRDANPIHRGGENIVVRYNTVRNNALSGIRVFVAGDVSVQIYGNTISGNRPNGISIERVDGILSARIHDNTIFENQKTEINISALRGSTALLEVYDNIVVSPEKSTPQTETQGDGQ